MIVALINFSGNAGKTTLAKHLMSPYFGVDTIHIESTNHIQSVSKISENKIFTTADSEAIETIYEKISFGENMVLDVGASDLKALLTGFKQYEGILDRIDRFIIPIASDSKQTIDSIKTAATLLANGVNPKNIYIIFNRVQPDDLFFDRFQKTVNELSDSRIFVYNREWYIPESSLFEICGELGYTVYELAESEKDYEQMMRDEYASSGIKDKNLLSLAVAKRGAMTLSKRFKSFANEMLR